DLEEVEREWDRQIVSLFELGLPLTHLDSEKHIHCWPRLTSIACRLAERHGLRWIRRSVEAVSPLRWDAGSWRARLLSQWGELHPAHPSVAFPDAVWGLAAQGRHLNAARLRRDWPRLRGCTLVEIACHPGCPRPGDGPLPASFGRLHVAHSWQTELNALLDPAWRELFTDEGCELTHYGLLDPDTREPFESLWACSADCVAA
ncbi:MAG TPA: ChbG/HpnK family deacetylase, partial [Planctomycetaceae bacterium]|nr:ChbG/HpnK family deacetylase [Planctomycetaceae bacterium]